MATIQSSTGQVLPDNGMAPYAPGQQQSPYNTYVSNMGNLLSYITAKTQSGTAGLQANTQGLTAAEKNLATPGGAGNPLNSLYAFMPGSAQTKVSETLGDIYHPAILSQENQAANMAQTSGNLATQTKTTADLALASYEQTKPNWTLSPTPNENGEFYFYNTNTPAGQPTQVYAAGKIPSEKAGSLNESTFENGYTASDLLKGTGINIQAYMKDQDGYQLDTIIGKIKERENVGPGLRKIHNLYGITASDNTMTMFKDLGVTVSPITAGEGGAHFIAFQTDSDSEKAARRLLQSPSYAGETVDQAIRSWSGYNGNAPTNITAPSGNLIDRTATQIADPTSGVSFDSGFSTLNSLYGGKITQTQLFEAVRKIKPDFNLAQSNAQISTQGDLASKGSGMRVILNRNNAIMDGVPAKNGQPAIDGLLAAYDKMDASKKTGSGWLGGILSGAGTGSGYGKVEQDNYNRLINDVTTNVNSLLSAGSNLGVTAGNVAVSALFPPNLSRQGLIDAIAAVKNLQEVTTAQTEKGGGAVQTTGGLNSTSQSILNKYGIQ